MSSSIEGVQAKIKEKTPLALYTHCFSHCLNLSIAASCKVQEARNLVALINEVYLFLSKSLKRQRFPEVAIKTNLPESTHLKLHGLCKTRWVERHTCFEVFYELYETFISYLDAMISPHQYPEFSPVGSDHSWNWDRDTKLRAQGLKASLSSFQTIAVFLITKNALDEVKSIASKLQKCEQDIFEAYQMVTLITRCSVEHCTPHAGGAWLNELGCSQ